MHKYYDCLNDKTIRSTLLNDSANPSLKKPSREMKVTSQYLNPSESREQIS